MLAAMPLLRTEGWLSTAVNTAPGPSIPQPEPWLKPGWRSSQPYTRRYQSSSTARLTERLAEMGERLRARETPAAELLLGRGVEGASMSETMRVEQLSRRRISTPQGGHQQHWDGRAAAARPRPSPAGAPPHEFLQQRLRYPELAPALSPPLMWCAAGFRGQPRTRTHAAGWRCGTSCQWGSAWFAAERHAAERQRPEH
jgi:hypothetical protein